MKVVIATPILFEKESPFNHLFKGIIGGFLNAGYEVERHVAVRNGSEDDYTYGFKDVSYIKYKRKESAHGNIIGRYFRDTLTSIRESRGIRHSCADVLFEDVTYSSFWTISEAKKKGMRIVAMLQDIWPDNAVQSGLIKHNSLLYRFFEVWQRYIYINADKIICISDDMKDFLNSKGIDEDKIEVIYNWGYSDKPIIIPWNENLFVQKYKLKKDFYAVYAGNIGRMQNVDLIIRAAKKMPETKFLIVGNGVRMEEIKRKIDNTHNITMYPFQPPELATHIYSMAGVNLIPLVEGGSKTAMPSKTGVVLSCGRPVIFCFGSESRLAKIAEDYGAGMCVSAIDEDELIKAIESQKTVKGYCEGAHRLFEDLFSKENNINKYVEILDY